MTFWREEVPEELRGVIFDHIKKHRVLNDDGRVSYVGNLDHEGWIAALVSAVGFQVRTNSLRSRVVRATLLSSELPSEFSESDFRKVALQILGRYQNVELSGFRVAFPIWNRPRFLQGVKRIGDVTLCFTPSQKTQVFSRIVREREKQQAAPEYAHLFTRNRLGDLRQCSLCVAYVQANSPSDANERASEAVYEVLGLVNLVNDVNKNSRYSVRVAGKLPVSEVLIGPHTSVHDETGRLAYSGFWFENWAGGPDARDLDDEVWAAWARRVKKLELRLSISPWREQCKSAVVRYYSAFSNPNLEESFIEGWRLFETVSGKRNDKITRQLLRASKVFKNHMKYLAIGTHLLVRRNFLTHGHAIKADDEEMLAFQMRLFVSPLLEFYILNGLGFKSPNELWDFLDLSANPQDRDDERGRLERRLVLLKNASAFRGD